MKERNKYRVLNVIFYLLLAYQFAILLLGVLRYNLSIHLHVLLYPFSFLLIYFYIMISYTKEDGIHWHSVLLKLEQNDELDTSAGEIMYNLQKRIVLVLVIILSALAVIFAVVNIIQNSVVLYKYILSTFGISALAIFILTIILGLKVIIQFLQKPWKKADQNVLFNMLVLQNFLISTSILKMLSNIRG